MKIEKKLLELIANHDGYYCRPPLCERKLYFKDSNCEMVICLNNDGHETWIGSMNEWHTHMKNKTFRKLCFWYLKTWALADWFGLRSTIYYWLLSRRVSKFKPQ
jgi:hypothetical protein